MTSHQWRQEEEQLPGEASGTGWLSLFIIAPQLDLFVNCDYICTPYNVNGMINRPRKQKRNERNVFSRVFVHNN